MTSSLTLIFLCLLFFRTEIAALQVTPGSPCAAVCLDDPKGDVQDPAASSTNSSDIVCTDEEYSTSASGIRFKNCVECLQESQVVNDKENDISWYLYNLRYSVDVCLYNFPNETSSKSISSPCSIDFGCQPLQKALEAGKLNPENGTQLDYCEADGGAFSGSQLHDCIQCFRSSPNQFFMSNFLTALQAGCEQKPKAGELIGLSGSLFTQFDVNITDAPQNETASASSSDTSDTVMTTGAIVGIVVGAVLLLLGGAGLFYVYHRKQKFYRERLESANGRKSMSPPLLVATGYPHYQEGKKNALPADWELRAQQPHANNAEYYETMEKPVQGGQHLGYAYEPSYLGYQTAYGQHGTLPTHPAYIPRVSSRSGSRNDTPSPPPTIRSNRPDAYAANAYLNAATAPTTMPIIPSVTTTITANGRDARPPQPQPQIQAYPYHPLAQPTTLMPPRGSSLKSPPAQQSHFPSGVPPPPPPRLPASPPAAAQRTPRLSMPTLPKNRKPTKYAPPSLVVVPQPLEDVVYTRSHSDNSDRENMLPIGLSMPPKKKDEGPRWEQESYAGYGSRTGTPPDQLAADRKRRRVTEFKDID